MEELEIKPEVKPASQPKLEEERNSWQPKKMKSISSTDYMYILTIDFDRSNVNSSEMKDRLAKFSTAKSISSDDYYGMPKKNKSRDNEDGILDKAKEVGYTVFETAKGHMSNVILIFYTIA